MKKRNYKHVRVVLGTRQEEKGSIKEGVKVAMLGGIREEKVLRKRDRVAIK